MKKKLKIVLFSSQNNAVGYYRMWQIGEWINKLGLAECRYFPNNTEPFPFEKAHSKPGILSFAEQGEWADVIVFMRASKYLHVSIMEALREKFNKPLAFEIDDNLLSINKKHPQYNLFKKLDVNEVFDSFIVPAKDAPRYDCGDNILQTIDENRVRVTAQVRTHDERYLTSESIKLSNWVTVSTDPLKEAYKDLNKNISVLHNCIDFDKWDKLPERFSNGDKIILGWCGGAQHEEDLDMVLRPIEELLERHPNLHFHFAGCSTHNSEWLLKYGKHKDRIKSLPRSKGIDDWGETFASWNFDIGVIPVMDNTFNRSKSNLKFMEFSARKIPTVATNLTPYAEIHNGETGFLVNNNSRTQWVDYVSALVENEQLRKRIGINAYEYVKDKYDIKNNVQKWVEVYKEVAKNYKEEKEKCQNPS